jgi:hypothetical protein
MKQVSMPSCQDTADLSGSVLAANGEPSLSHFLAVLYTSLTVAGCALHRSYDKWIGRPTARSLMSASIRSEDKCEGFLTWLGNIRDERVTRYRVPENILPRLPTMRHSISHPRSTVPRITLSINTRPYLTIPPAAGSVVI